MLPLPEISQSHRYPGLDFLPPSSQGIPWATKIQRQSSPRLLSGFAKLQIIFSTNSLSEIPHDPPSPPCPSFLSFWPNIRLINRHPNPRGCSIWPTFTADCLLTIADSENWQNDRTGELELKDLVVLKNFLQCPESSDILNEDALSFSLRLQVQRDLFYSYAPKSWVFLFLRFYIWRESYAVSLTSALYFWASPPIDTAFSSSFSYSCFYHGC